MDPGHVRSLIVAVVALAMFGVLVVILFDTPWNRLLLGILLVTAWLAIAARAWNSGVPFLPSGLGALPEQPNRTAAMRRWVGPTWMALTVTWIGAGWLVTNGGG